MDYSFINNLARHAKVEVPGLKVIQRGRSTRMAEWNSSASATTL